MTGPDEWDSLREAWRPADDPIPTLHDAEVTDLVARAGRARRSLALVAAAEVLIVVVAVVGIGAALRHSASVGEAIVGFSVIIGIAIAWVGTTAGRRTEHERAHSSAIEYLGVLRAVRHRQIRFVYFAWLVLGLALVFLIVWWASGFAVHRGELGAPIAIASLWVPLTVMVGFVAWTARMRKVASAELIRLGRLERDLRAE